MAGTSTIYDVKVKYTMDAEKASSGMQTLVKHTDQAKESVFSLKHALEAMAVEKVFHLGKELLIDFNQEMDNLKISMTTVMQMNMHMPFEKASAAADKLFFTFQDMAKKSPLMTKDFMEMASAIAPAVSMAGGGVGKLEKMTQGALTAGLAFHVRPDQMAMDIQEMLAGNVRLTSRTARQLLAAKGLDHKEFNDLSAKKRAETTESILSDPAILKSAERMAHTMAGEVSTLKDNIQIAFGEVGKPLVHSITEEFGKMNAWIEKHPKLIKEWVTSFSEGISTAFGYLRDVASFFVDHKELLFSLAKIFVAFKGAQIAGNVFKAFAGGVGNMVEALKKGTGGITDALSGGKGLFGAISGVASGFMSLLGPLAMAAGAITILSGVIDELDGTAEAHRKAQQAQVSLHEATMEIPNLQAREQELRATIKNVTDAGVKERLGTELTNVHSQLNDPEKLGTALKKINEENLKISPTSANYSRLTDEQWMKIERFTPAGLLGSTMKDLKDGAKVQSEVMGVLLQVSKMDLDEREKVLKYAFPEQYGMPTPKETTAPAEKWEGLSDKNVNLTIQRVEVASEDPDRFVFGLVTMADQAIKHATQSVHTTPGGF